MAVEDLQPQHWCHEGMWPAEGSREPTSSQGRSASHTRLRAEGTAGDWDTESHQPRASMHGTPEEACQLHPVPSPTPRPLAQVD